MISTAEITTKLQKYELLIEAVNTNPLDKFSGIQTDSRNVKKDYVFVCIVGFIDDGHDFAQAAVDEGAQLLIVER